MVWGGIPALGAALTDAAARLSRGRETDHLIFFDAGHVGTELLVTDTAQEGELSGSPRFLFTF